MIRSMRGAIGRRVAIGAGSRAELRRRSRRAWPTCPTVLDAAQELAKNELELQIAAWRARLDRIPYLDTFDLR